MNNLGINSAYSAYMESAKSIFNSAPVSSLESKRESSSAENSSSPSSTYGEIKDEAIISNAAKALLAKEEGETQPDLSNKAKSQSEADVVQSKKELTTEQEQQVAQLKARDSEVRAHEQAHIAAASGIGASAPTFEYQKGPDGKKYAIGGEVSLSFSKGANPADTIAKAQSMKAAALAPAEPSGQDMSVARAAEKMIQEAKQELAEKNEQSKKAAKSDDSEELFKDKNDKRNEKDVDELPALKDKSPQSSISPKAIEI